MHLIERLIAISILILVAQGCRKTESEKDLVAEVYGSKLFKSELNALIDEKTTFEDSIFITKEYIQNWIRRRVLLHESEKVLTSAEMDKKEELEKYKEDLIMYETLQKLSSKNTDTIFEEGELIQYYQENEAEFILTQNAVRMIFYKLPSNTPKLEKLWQGFKSDDVKSISQIRTIASKSGNLFEDGQSWVLFDDVLKEVPINTYNQERFLSNNKIIKIEENQFTYFLKLIDFKIKSELSPFEMETNRIKMILLNKRQRESIKNIETELIDRAYNQNKITIN